MRDTLNAFLHPDLEPIANGDGELGDKTLAIKDNISVKDWPVTAASKILEGYIAPYDATVIKRLRESGVTFVGKTNLDDAAMGSSTENSAFGVTKNPWNQSLVAGGSSGGSAAAVAAGLCDVALGSDTGGSIRQPAAFCGVTGFKPTYGSVSRYGLVALASSFDVIGPIARSAVDVEKVFSVISGKDPLDQTTIDYRYEPTEIDFSTLRVGLPSELWQLDINPEVKAANQKMVDWLKAKGATVVDVSMPTSPHALKAYSIILPAEASANLARNDGIRFRRSEQAETLLDRYRNTRAFFGAEVKRRILIGTFALSVGHYDAYYQLAVKIQGQVMKEFEDVFTQVDIIINPTTPTPAFAIGEKANDPIAMYQCDLLTVPANLALVPSLSLPVGFTEAGLPIGGQITAARTNDNIVLAVAKAFQAETDHHSQKPSGEFHG